MMKTSTHSTPIYIRIAIFFIPLILLSLSCAFSASDATAEPADLPTALRQDIDQTWDQYQDVKSIWTQVIDADVPVSCDEKIIAMDLFTLTQSEADAEPDSIAVRDEINLAHEKLSRLISIWNIECTINRQVIPVAELREIQTLLDEAENHIYAADILWWDWQS